jgi:hypothetical protein
MWSPNTTARPNVINKETADFGIFISLLAAIKRISS